MADDRITLLVVDGREEGGLVEGLLGGRAPGHAVTHAATVADARRALTSAAQDCVVVDLGQLDHDGGWPSELAASVLRDELTGLPTRRLLEDRLAQALERARRTDAAVAVGFLDVDRLATVNDAAGHAVGDAILSEVAARLHATMRASDTLARHAGDEFVAVWEGVDGERDAVVLGRRLLEAFDAPLQVENEAFTLTASVGIVLAQPDDEPTRILRDATTAMDRAKSRGGGQVELFDETMRVQALAAVRDEQALREALARGAFDVRYAPIVDAETGTAWGASATVSWPHAERGPVLLPEMLEIAGRARLSTALTDWLLRQVCRQLATWDATAPDALWTRVSVKLAPEQLRDSALPDRVAAALARSGISGERLRLEVDEHALAPAQAAANLERLSAMGVALLLDDFGTGASSLGLLRRVPIAHLKVGGSLISGLADNPAAQRIVEAVGSMAESLGLAVTAAGIATPEVLRAAVELPMTWLQGPAISEPLPGEAFAGWVEEARGVEALSRAGVTQSRIATGEVTLVQAAEVLGVSVSTVRRWADSGRLASTRTPGGHRRVQRADLRRMARATRGPAALRSARLPAQALPLAAQALGIPSAELTTTVANVLYEQPTDSWLADPVATTLVAGWHEQLAASCASGRYGPVLTETQRLGRHARLAGATMLECFLFLDAAGAVLARAVRRQAPAAEAEAAELHRLCRALAQAVESEA